MDDWYHAAAIRAFYENDGPVSWDYWEFAPFGRPHLYPPLIHTVGAILAKTLFSGMETSAAVLNAMLVLKGVSFAFLLFSIWVLGRLISEKTAFFAVLLASQPVALLLSSTIMLPSGFALALLNIFIYFFEKKNFLAAATFLALIAYTHLGIFLLSMLLILIISIYRKKYAYGLFMMAAALAAYTPWLLHILKNYSVLEKASVSTGVSIPIVLTALALIGMNFMASRKKETFTLLIAYSLSLVPMLLGYGNRFWSYILIPLAVFASYAIAEIKWERQYRWIIFWLILLSFIYVPTLHAKDSYISYHLPINPGGTMVPSTINLELTQLSKLDSPLSKEETHILDWISKNTAPKDIITADDALAPMIFTGTGRRATGGMWQETAPKEFREQMKRFEETKKGVIVRKDCPEKTKTVTVVGRYKVCLRD